MAILQELSIGEARHRSRVQPGEAKLEDDQRGVPIIDLNTL